jgi:hypothetical protein
MGRWRIAANLARPGGIRLAVCRRNDNPCLAGLFEADDGSRTRDLRLGKPTLYQLSYVRAAAILGVVQLRPAHG